MSDCGNCLECQKCYTHQIGNSKKQESNQQQGCSSCNSKKQMKPMFRGFTVFNTNDCNLRCGYCHEGNTPVLMSDLTWKPIKDIKIGDIVIGVEKCTTPKEHRWKYVESTVLNKSVRRSNTVKVVTDKGSTVCTEDHEWLRSDGDYHPTNKLRSRGIKWLSNPVENFKHEEDYKIGWLCGMIEGDGTTSNYQYEYGKIKRFRLSSKDIEIIERFIQYTPNIEWHHFTHDSMYNAIRTDVIQSVEYIEEICKNKLNSYAFKAGYLGGIFDAEGSYNKNLRIHNKDPIIINTVTKYLTDFGIESKVEKRKNGMMSVIIPMQYNRVKFLSISTPALGRKISSFLSESVYGNAKILDVIDNGVTDVYNITTSTENYIASGMISHNCFIYKYERNFGTNRKMKPETGKRAILYLLSQNTPWEDVSMHWFGGEPLVAFDVIKEVTEWGHNITEGLPKNVRFGLTTNLTLLNDKINDFLKEHDYFVLCSIDGTQKSHDSFRKYADGSGSWKDAIAGLKKVQSWNNRYTVRWTIHPSQIDQIIPGTETFVSMGVKNIAHEFVYETDWTYDNLDELEQALDELTDINIKRLKSGEDPIYLKPVRDVWNSFFGNMKIPDRCGIGQGDVGLDVDGNMFRCHRFVDQNHSYIGNIWDGIDMDKWNEGISFNTSMITSELGKAECLSCPTRMSCNGGCLAVNYDTTGDIYTLPKSNCLVNMIKWRSTKRFISNLIKENLFEAYIRSLEPKEKNTHTHGL